MWQHSTGYILLVAETNQSEKRQRKEETQSNRTQDTLGHPASLHQDSESIILEGRDGSQTRMSVQNECGNVPEAIKRAGSKDDNVR